ncbi:MAG: hypothetical protein M3P26_08245 [Gemmatimonadota bacterium]|nr:hypothetical protein [Gemmatimonadota bacterium]
MRQILRSIAAASCLLAADTASLAAQTTTALAPGARVKLITPRLEISQQMVRIISATSDSVEFRSEGYPATRTIALSDVAAVEVHSDGQRPFLRNMLIGAGLGASLGGIISSVAYKECGSCGYFRTSRGQETAGGAIVGGAAGLVVGLAVAALQKGERWTRITLNTNVAFRPTAGGRFALTGTRSL